MVLLRRRNPDAFYKYFPKGWAICFKYLNDKLINWRHGWAICFKYLNNKLINWRHGSFS